MEVSWKSRQVSAGKLSIELLGVPNIANRDETIRCVLSFHESKALKDAGVDRAILKATVHSGLHRQNYANVTALDPRFENAANYTI